jgi:hypothetical protein
VPICTRCTLVDLTPKYPTLATSSPGCRPGAAPGGADAVRNALLSDMAAAGSCFGVWILGFHWRSRVSWGPTCGPSHIDPLLEEAISGVSRPAFVPWAGTTCAGPTGARFYLPAPKGP